MKGLLHVPNGTGAAIRSVAEAPLMAKQHRLAHLEGADAESHLGQQVQIQTLMSPSLSRWYVAVRRRCKTCVAVYAHNAPGATRCVRT